MSPNEKSQLLRKLVRDPKILVMPGAHDGLSAKVLEAAGFQAIQCSSWGMAVAAGLPEGDIFNFAENRETTRQIVRSVNVPVNADVEDGHGGPRHAYHCAREMILVGAAGMNMEDKARREAPTEPVRLVSLETQLEKIAAVLQARRELGSDFFLNARTDALTVTGADPTEAVKEAIRRGNAFLEAGADMVFVWGTPDRDQIQTLTKSIAGPVAISGSHRSEGPSVQELQELGVARVSYGSETALVSAGGVQRLARAILEGGTVAGVDDLAHQVNIRELVLSYPKL